MFKWLKKLVFGEKKTKIQDYEDYQEYEDTPLIQNNYQEDYCNDSDFFKVKNLANDKIIVVEDNSYKGTLEVGQIYKDIDSWESWEVIGLCFGKPNTCFKAFLDCKKLCNCETPLMTTDCPIGTTAHPTKPPVMTTKPPITTTEPPFATTEPPLMTTQETSIFFSLTNCQGGNLTVEDDSGQGIMQLGQEYLQMVGNNCWFVHILGSSHADLTINQFLSNNILVPSCSCGNGTTQPPLFTTETPIVTTEPPFMTTDFPGSPIFTTSPFMNIEPPMMKNMEITKWTCINGKCFPSPNGEYSSKQDCQKNCGKKL